MPNYKSDPFFQYATVTHKTTEGDVALPMFFYDSSGYFALFYVDLDKARSLTQAEELEPVEFHKGKALAAVASFDYRELSINPYLEVGLAIACVPCGSSAPLDPAAALLAPSDSHSMGFYVVDLPVSTDQATAAGIDIWGFPKFTTDIGFHLADDHFAGQVADPDGRLIYSLTGESFVGATLPALNMVYFTRLHGTTLRIHSYVRGVAKYALPGSMRLSLGDSDHRMARNLAALGLDGAQPDMVFFSPHLQLRLTAGAPLT